jgi:hypothetical protein
VNVGTLVTWWDETLQAPLAGTIEAVDGAVVFVRRHGKPYRLQLIEVRELRTGPRPSAGQFAIPTRGPGT